MRMKISKFAILSQQWGLPGVLITLLMFPSLFLFGQKGTPLNPAVPQALYLLETEQTRKALAELEQAVMANPLESSLLYYLGYAQIKTGDRTKALASFNKGVEVNDKEPLNYVGIGWVDLLEKKTEDAKIQFDKALSMTRSKNVAVIKGIAEADLVDNKYSVDAISLLNKVKSSNDTDPDVQILLGDTYLIQNSGGNVGQAVSSYENAIAIKVLDAKAKSHSDAKAYFRIGTVFQKSKNNEVAQENFIKSIKADSNYTPSYGELGEIYYLNKEAEKAVKTYKKYLSLTENPENPQYQYQYAFFLFMAKDYKKANDVFSKIADAKNVTVTTLRFYAVSLFNNDDFKKSREISERYFAKAKPEDIEANDYMYYGKSLLKLKQDSLAALALQKSLDLNKNQPDVLQLLGGAYSKAKKFGQAVACYKQLMVLHKTPFASDYFLIGVAYYNNNQFEQADSSFVKLIEMQPKRIEPYAWLARTKANEEEARKEPGLAKPYFEKVMELAAGSDKNKRELIESYNYLSYYYYDKKDYPTAKSIYEKWLAIDPNNKQVTDALETLKKIEAKK